MPTLAPSPSVRPAWATSRKRWTVDEFHEIYSLPAFESTRLVLLDGEILDMPNPNAPHDAGLGLALAALVAAFGPGFWVRGQMALRLNQTTDPMPDIAIVPGTPRDYPRQPTTALQVVEVSDSTLAIDTGVKAELYAAAGIEDYWVVDVNHRRLIVHRGPQPDTAAAFGASYATADSLTAGQSVAPLARPQSTVSVTDLLP
jgi:Uma2 family endonuclease